MSDAPADAAPSTPTPDELLRMGFWEHLEELRKRLMRAALAFVAAFMGCFAFSRQIYEFLSRPINAFFEADAAERAQLLAEKMVAEQGMTLEAALAVATEQVEVQKLVFLTVTTPFVLYLKVAALAGVFVASPIVLYQAWSFIAPGLYKKEKRAALPFLLFASSLFLGGGAFGYYIAFPAALDFLLQVGQPFEAAVTVNHYLGFLMTVILGLGLMFELPAVILILARLGLVTPGFLLRQTRIAIVLIFVVAALITPTPDIFNLCLFALPTIALYFVGIALAWFVSPKEARSASS